ncbi:hypothetical protein Q9L58_009948 [Maublancomyces gigas]|uniref:Uncharacterized protein n=1 Tax=Discina gigas TaxID=1032678 RepID=A0ABR3G6J1_9PEZI
MALMKMCEVNTTLQLTRKQQDKEASSASRTAIQALIADVESKERKSAGAGDRQFRVRVANEADDEDDHEDDEGEEGSAKSSRVESVALLDAPTVSMPAGPPIHIHTVDPDATDIAYGQYPWSGPGNRPTYTGVLAQFTTRELVNLLKKHMPEGRAVRVIFGATENPAAASGANMPVGNPAHIQLTDTNEVEAWVASNNARPFGAQVVPNRTLREGYTPAPDGFAFIEDEDCKMIDIPTEDSDHVKNMRVTKEEKRFGMPLTDEPFQRFIRKLVLSRD